MSEMPEKFVMPNNFFVRDSGGFWFFVYPPYANPSDTAVEFSRVSLDDLTRLKRVAQLAKDLDGIDWDRCSGATDPRGIELNNLKAELDGLIETLEKSGLIT